MRVVLLPVLMLTTLVFAWLCPECGTENQDSYCFSCHLPQPPEGMTYVPATTVEVNGEAVDVPPFFIDSSPVTYRDFLPWLNGSGFGVQELGVIITGGGGEAMEFLAFTPFIGDQTGGITVPSQCLEHPAASITWSGAQSFLSDQGKRLPTLAEMYAASNAGLIENWDSYQVMLGFSDHLRASLGDMLGTLGTQAMFAGYSTERERIMWELTGTVLGDDPLDTAPAVDARYIVIYKEADERFLSSVDRDNGYFNIIFRGAIEVPR